MKHDIPKAALTPGGSAPASHYPSGLARPYLHPHRLPGSLKDWGCIESYRRDTFDAGEWLRSRQRPRSPINGVALASSTLLWAVIGACFWLIVSGAL